MKIKRIAATNYRSYRNLDVELKDFNVIIGPNAAGKSNCLSVLKFFKDLANYGLDNAISLQGGVEFLRNIYDDSSDNSISFAVVFVPDKNFKFFKEKNGEKYRFEIKEFEYRFKIAIDLEKDGYEILEDETRQLYDAYKETASSKEPIGEGRIFLRKKAEKFEAELETLAELPFEEKELLETFFIGFEDFILGKKLLKTSLLKKKILFETPLYFAPHFETLKEDFKRIAFYDFDARTPKFAAIIASKAELEEDGSNLARVLKRILSNEEDSRRFANLLKYLAPFVESISVEKVLDKYLRITAKETYSKGERLPAFLMSEGSIFILELIVALYFENSPIIILEEPERRIHPYLISKIVDMAKDASLNKQIILSTHNPEIVKHAGLDNIYLVSRDARGFSNVARPHKKKEIVAFLENEIGIEELFVQNLIK